jgi:hypothetical protein
MYYIVDNSFLIIMKKIKIKPFNVIDNTELPVITVYRLPVDGDPIEIEREMYYACETQYEEKNGVQEIGVIPLVVRNPAKVTNIKNYIKCLRVAQRRIQFRRDNNICDFNDCDEMIIT